MPETVNVAVPFLSPREVEDKAKEVLKRHNLTTVPIDPVLLAQREGIRVNNAKFSDDNVVGMIVKRGDDVSMLVNYDDPPFRKRFTIAHELGHHFLHLMGDGEYIDIDGEGTETGTQLNGIKLRAESSRCIHLRSTLPADRKG